LERPESEIPFKGGARRGRRTTVAATRGMEAAGKEGVGGVAHL